MNKGLQVESWSTKPQAQTKRWRIFILFYFLSAHLFISISFGILGHVIIVFQLDNSRLSKIRSITHHSYGILHQMKQEKKYIKYTTCFRLSLDIINSILTFLSAMLEDALSSNPRSQIAHLKKIVYLMFSIVKLWQQQVHAQGLHQIWE